MIHRLRGAWNAGRLSKARTEAFSDGVFSIAATLLVLDIRFPKLPESAGTAGLAAGLLSVLPNALAYVLSFAVVCIYWVNHHQLLMLVERVTRGLLWLNGLFLMLLAFIAFPTALIGEHPFQPLAASVYGIVMALIGLAYHLLHSYILRTPGVIPEAAAERLRSGARLPEFSGALLYGGSAAIAWASPVAAIVLYFAIAIAFIFPHALGFAKAEGAE